jgi:hypothetical protein
MATRSQTSFRLPTSNPRKNLSSLPDNCTLSEANMALALAWKSSCFSHHLRCAAATNESVLPSYVINVRNEKWPVLEGGGCRRERYLALSYKWGETRRYLTLTSNITRHYDNIPYEELPKTFQDAILITHRLGFGYLWIDALCIIHDSPENLHKEISHMGDIYHGASLTLFAKVGDSAEHGLSTQRDHRTLKPCLLNLKATFEGHTTEACTFAEYYPGYTTEDSALYRRGWVLQEEVLSLRLLKFGRKQIRWECQGFGARESQPCAEDQPTLSLMKSQRLPYVSMLRSLLQEPKLDQAVRRSGWGLFDCWDAIVVDYCERSLTYQSDNLPALAGVARTVATRYQLTYINGLWKEDFCDGLLWACVNKVDAAKHPLEAALNSTFPSWTWFSQWGKSIQYPNNYHRRNTHTMYTISGLRHLGNHNLAIYGSEFTQGSLDETPYQHASMTALMLVGYCTIGKVDLDRSIEKTHSTIDIYDDVSGVPFDCGYKHLVVTPDTKEIIGLAIFDLDMDTESTEEIICCFCTIYTGRPGYEDLPGITCLVLVATQWPGEYRRVGFLGWKFPEELHHIADPLQLIEHLPPWFRTGPQQTITLI